MTVQWGCDNGLCSSYYYYYYSYDHRQLFCFIMRVCEVWFLGYNYIVYPPNIHMPNITFVAHPHVGCATTVIPSNPIFSQSLT